LQLRLETAGRSGVNQRANEVVFAEKSSEYRASTVEVQDGRLDEIYLDDALNAVGVAFQ